MKTTETKLKEKTPAHRAIFMKQQAQRVRRASAWTQGKAGDHLRAKGALVVLCLAMLFVSQAQAQLIPTQLNGGTNNVAANSTNSYTEVIQVNHSQYLAVQLGFKMVAAGATSNVVVALEQSVDGTNWHTSPHALAGTANGTTWVTVATNFTVGGIPFFRPIVRNTNSIAATNIVVNPHQKPGI